jgi:basic membrane protein A
MARRRWYFAVALILALGLVAAACSSDDSSDTTDTTAAAGADTTAAAGTDTTAAAGADTTAAVAAGEECKVAFVHVGPTADKGWSWAHDQGRQFLESNMPNVKTTTLESIPEGPDSQRVFEDLAADGNQLIFGTSFGYMDPMLAAAENFPDVAFMHATGFKTSENMGNYFGAAEEARYLSGMAAGDRTETGLIGYVAAFPIPEVLRGINAFTLGVREINPDAEVQVVWTSTWFDPPVEGDAAQALLDNGADVIAMHQDSSAPGQAAEAAGAGWVGYNSDMTEFGPTAWLTAATWDWGPYYLKTAQEVCGGTWTAEAFYGNMADGMVTLAPFGPSVSDAIGMQITERQGQIIDGSFVVFPDPIVDQDGNERELGNIFEMDYFVEGVVGSASG